MITAAGAKRAAEKKGKKASISQDYTAKRRNAYRGARRKKQLATEKKKDRPPSEKRGTNPLKGLQEENPPETVAQKRKKLFAGGSHGETRRPGKNPSSTRRGGKKKGPRATKEGEGKARTKRTITRVGWAETIANLEVTQKEKKKGMVAKATWGGRMCPPQKKKKKS